MLAGYLPFDDDPANPEGDNINLLYKYIVSTPLTFPEYVSPHARDLLRRILVPDQRQEQICSKLRVTAGSASTATSLASSVAVQRATGILRRPLCSKAKMDN